MKFRMPIRATPAKLENCILPAFKNLEFELPTGAGGGGSGDGSEGGVHGARQGAKNSKKGAQI